MRRSISLSSKKVVREGFPPFVKDGGKKFEIAGMAWSTGEVKDVKRSLTRRGIKHRVVRVNNPKGWGSWIFYTEGGRKNMHFA